MRALENRSDVELLVKTFYEAVRQDSLIGPIFDVQVKVDWDVHIPKLVGFWHDMLFGGEEYRGRPFAPHIPLDLKPEHFERWLHLFFRTVDQLFHGHKADEVKFRAWRIAENFQANIKMIEESRAKAAK